MIDCDLPYDIVTIPGTTVISPNYPNYYGYNPNCQVTLIFDERVSIEFESFDIQGNTVENSCNYDWLQVHDGNSSDSETINSKICGYDTPSPMNSSRHSLTLVFHSNSSEKTHSGFNIMTHQGKKLNINKRHTRLIDK